MVYATLDCNKTLYSGIRDGYSFIPLFIQQAQMFTVRCKAMC